MTRYTAVSIIALFTVTVLYSLPGLAAENACGPSTPAEEQLQQLQIENETLTLRLKQLEGAPAISLDRLRQRRIQRLKDLAANVKTQRQATSEFEGYVKWMSTNLAGYNRYIQAGSYAAVVARVLPVPYAGQASLFTKFVAQFTMALNSASVSLNNYLNTSQKFLTMTDALDASKTVDDKAVTEAILFADRQLLKDTQEAQLRLSSISELSSGALSFLEGLNHYMGNTDEYWNKAKGIFKKDVDPKEKSFISESTSSLKAQADRFNSRLRTFEELGRKETASVKALAVYEELAAEAKKGTI